ncbi:hypothetical protein BD289DRAFT_501285 [Coniella lustricola]|uniref:Uncharacterized protein n=1 Tax=Coniella lustricola TaxID=2025994 RepID=A0A2T3A5N5_9PEZI|nr:hypothetical protein BD289DRAFT_501285 [Coniella lustricola]
MGPSEYVGKNLACLELIVVAKVIYVFEIWRDSDDNLGDGGAGNGAVRCNPLQFQTYNTFVSLQEGPLVQLSHHPRP